MKDPKLDELDQLVTRHRQLVEMIVTERNRRMSQLAVFRTISM